MGCPGNQCLPCQENRLCNSKCNNCLACLEKWLLPHAEKIVISRKWCMLNVSHIKIKNAADGTVSLLISHLP